MKISTEMISLIESRFSPTDASSILSAIASLDEQDFEHQDPDRIAGAILVLVKRRISNLAAIIESAKTDWRDLLMGAGLADDDWTFRLEETAASWSADSV